MQKVLFVVTAVMILKYKTYDAVYISLLQRTAIPICPLPIAFISFWYILRQLLQRLLLFLEHPEDGGLIPLRTFSINVKI